MTRSEIIADLDALGHFLEHVYSENNTTHQNFSKELTERFQEIIASELYRNGWFTQENVCKALAGIREWLKLETLTSFVQPYPFAHFQSKLGLILAGNIPLVGFHDVLCGLLSGWRLQVKMSSDDNRLLPLLVDALCERNPLYREIIELQAPRLQGFHAVIGTGSDTSLLHFTSYFKDIPHLLRGNRTSVAVLDGTESIADLQLLGEDIFRYYGRGCRNVTHLIVPDTYNFSPFFEAIMPYENVLLHKKYGNNYDYNKAIFLLSQQPLLDNGFVLLMETQDLHAPLAMVNFHRYTHTDEITRYINTHKEHIQCVVGKDGVAFGQTQQPRLDDFADNLNTMHWLDSRLH